MFGTEYLAQSYFTKLVSIFASSCKSARLAVRDLPDEDGPQFKVHQTAFILFVIFGLIGFVILFLVHYTAKLLLTLVVVEEPPPVYLPDEPSHIDNDARPTPEGGSREYITSSICKTLRYLRSKAGPFSPWRGIGASVVFMIANTAIQVIIAKMLQAFHVPLLVAGFIAGLVSVLLVSRFALAVTHIMISEPIPGKLWIQRVFDTPWSSALKTMPALFIFALCLQVVSIASAASNDEHLNPWIRVAILFAFSIGYIVIVIPALIVLIRVQASTLPDEINTIVPFDRTFGQDISLTGDALTIKGAWKSLNWSVMRRALVFLAKTVPILLLISGGYVATMLAVWLYAVIYPASRNI